jgi:isopenicillin N synthase-like dioxygenase
MLQRLTNHVLPSTTHRVRNPTAERAAHSRYSMPFFLHLRSDFVFKRCPAASPIKTRIATRCRSRPMITFRNACAKSA